jgi:hypothetical protein
MYGDGPIYRSQAGFSGIPNSNPWSEFRGNEPLPFGYTPHMPVHPQNGNSSLIEPGNARGTMASTPSTTAPQMPHAINSAHYFENPRRTRNSSNMPSSMNGLADGTHREQVRSLRAAREDMRTGKTQHSNNPAMM